MGEAPGKIVFRLHHTFVEMARTELNFLIVDTVFGPTKCYHVVRQGQDFFVATVGPYKCISQNLRKDSDNTRWISEDPDNRFLTWITEQNTYIGLCRTFVNDSGNLVTAVEVF